LVLDRSTPEALSLQIARQLQGSIESGRVAHGTCLPSTRALARWLGVSRNTALAAYEELSSRGFISSRRGSGVYAHVPAVVSRFDMGTVMRAAQFPARSLDVPDLDGNPIRICY
jgi:GntR family transcriptional regulator / MocR family aminotransferase